MRWVATLRTPEPGDVALLAAMRERGVVRRPGDRPGEFDYLSDRRRYLEEIIRDHFGGAGATRAREERAELDAAVAVVGRYAAAVATNGAEAGGEDPEERAEAVVAALGLARRALEAALRELRRPE